MIRVKPIDHSGKWNCMISILVKTHFFIINIRLSKIVMKFNINPTFLLFALRLIENSVVKKLKFSIELLTKMCFNSING